MQTLKPGVTLLPVMPDVGKGRARRPAASEQLLPPLRMIRKNERTFRVYGMIIEEKGPLRQTADTRSAMRTIAARWMSAFRQVQLQNPQARRRATPHEDTSSEEARRFRNPDHFHTPLHQKSFLPGSWRHIFLIPIS
jgi:hypothetical protein